MLNNSSLPKNSEATFNNRVPQREFRAKRGDVKLAILSVLSAGPLNGYELMKKIRELSGGEWRVSSGSIYPQLEHLSEFKLVNQSYAPSVYSSSEYIYYITEAGIKSANVNKVKIQAVWDNFKSVKFEGTALEIELQKLEQALSVLDNASPTTISKVVLHIQNLRKRIYLILSDESV